MLIDSHCHIHDLDYPIDANFALKNAREAGIEKIICIGTDAKNSQQAVDFANNHDNVFASVGVHPNNCQLGLCNLVEILDSKNPKIVAMGEIGLDYHYGTEHRDLQISLLKKQIELAIKYDLPIIFHVREAFDDFWLIIEEFKARGIKLRGVLHSFTDSQQNAERAATESLYIGVNGFSTFTKDETLQNMYKNLSLSQIILETDAPYSTPKPFRGKVNEPAYVRCIACYHASIRRMSIDLVESTTTDNVCSLFNI